MTVDVHEYIWGYLLYAKWATSAQSILLILIQTGEFYKLMKMNFIGLFRKSAYNNTYIYNLVDEFKKYIYCYLTSGVSINNVIILFDHYLQANPKPYMVYIDTNSYFIS